jgi:hypothetical protein
VGPNVTVEGNGTERWWAERRRQDGEGGRTAGKNTYSMWSIA